MQIRSTVVATNATQQLTVQCTKCLSHLGIPVYVDVPTTGHPGHVAQKPLYCPRCQHQRTFRTYDYADILITDYFGLTRKGALEVISLFNELTLQGRLPTIKGYGKPIDPQDLLHLHWGFKTLLARQAITPLMVSCSSCAGTFTMLRSQPDLHQTPPVYCIWCGAKGSSTISTNQDDTEDSSWLSLANHYSLSVQATQFFYNDWSSLPTHTYLSFAEYLTSPSVAPLVNAARQSLKVS